MDRRENNLIEFGWLENGLYHIGKIYDNWHDVEFVWASIWAVKVKLFQSISRTQQIWKFYWKILEEQKPVQLEQYIKFNQNDKLK